MERTIADAHDHREPGGAKLEISPAVIYVIGVPAVGKYTIAKEIGRLAGARVVDNQLINLPLQVPFVGLLACSLVQTTERHWTNVSSGNTN